MASSCSYYYCFVAAFCIVSSISDLVVTSPPPWVTLENNNHTNEISSVPQETTVQYRNSENATERSINSVMATQPPYPSAGNVTTTGPEFARNSSESKEASSSGRNSEIPATALPSSTTTNPPVELNPEEMRQRALKGFMQVSDLAVTS